MLQLEKGVRYRTEGGREDVAVEEKWKQARKEEKKVKRKEAEKRGRKDRGNKREESTGGKGGSVR